MMSLCYGETFVITMIKINVLMKCLKERVKDSVNNLNLIATYISLNISLMRTKSVYL